MTRYNEVVANVQGTYSEKGKRNCGNSAEFYNGNFPQAFLWARGERSGTVPTSL